MADKKVSQLTEVTSLPDGAKLYAVDSSRAEGDRDVQIAKSNLVTSTGSSAGNDSHINLEDYGAVADNLGDAGVDSTTAFKNAIADLIALGGGRLYIPFTDGKRFNIDADIDTPVDYSNITIFGGGRIFITDQDPLGNTGRGQFINFASNVENFTIHNIDILVSSGCVRNEFYRGVIGSRQGNFKNINILDCVIKNEVKPEDEAGVDAITFYADSGDADYTQTIEYLTVKGCEIELFGRSVYGIQLRRKTLYANIEGNTVSLQYTNQLQQSYNPIAMYGDGEFFTIRNNTVLGGGHSGIACSMAANGIVDGNFVYNITNPVEAGIEIEYKVGHGSAPFMTENINVVNNYVNNCEYGIWVMERDSSPTSLAPRNINIQGNIVEDCIEVGIFACSGLTGTPDYTSRISDISIKDNIVTGATPEGITVYDGHDTEISGNTIKGTGRGIMLGRNANIYPTGFLKVSNNKIIDATVHGIQQESGQAHVIYDSNVVKNNTVHSFNYGNPVAGAKLTCINNISIDSGNRGFTFLNWQANAGTVIRGNEVHNSANKSYDVKIFNGIGDNNMAVNCAGSFTMQIVGSTVLGYNPNY
tara:strand:+ start:294 stop:2054 length:1761 start_codon:yes stop_codon:yes gene_type:complete